MCLHSAPLAGNLIFLNVTGHFSDTLTPVCWIPSSELLKNHFLTVKRIEQKEYEMEHRLQVISDSQPCHVCAMQMPQTLSIPACINCIQAGHYFWQYSALLVEVFFWASLVRQSWQKDGGRVEEETHVSAEREKPQLVIIVQLQESIPQIGRERTRMQENKRARGNEREKERGGGRRVQTLTQQHEETLISNQFWPWIQQCLRCSALWLCFESP